MSIKWPRLLTPTQLSQLIRSQKSPLKALEIFKEAKARYPNYHHNGPVYSAMINILGISGRINEMKDVISQMKEDSCKCQDSVFAFAIKTYARAGLLDEAISLFRSLSQFNCVNRTGSFNILLEIMMKESKLISAYQLFLENSCCWEVKSRTRCLNLLMDALCQMHRSDLALNVFQEMNYQCCYPDRETYRILMKGLCKDGRLSEATHLLYSMFWRISQKGSGADVTIYRILLETLCDYGEVDEAMNILNKVLRKGLKAPKKHYKHLDLDSCYEGSRVDINKVKVLINEALIKGGIPSTDSYITMAIDFYSEGKIDEGNKVLTEMHTRGFRQSLSVYEAKISALFRDARVEDAIAVIEKEMMGNNLVPTVQLYNAIVKGLCDDRKSFLAMKYLEKMLGQVGCVPNCETYAILVDGLCNDGKFIEASQLLDEMILKSHWPRDETFNKVIHGLCLMGRTYKASMWLEEMISQAKLPEVSTWHALVSSVCFGSLTTKVFAAKPVLTKNFS
ncbi:hypothetical protein M9H77_09520 [Catharanthus roseus]|uniref:Uncharacterized protein n=1 Tax=Catharanthus roseus TaxID=4058 RepID=A0ACC0C113_CATRO|nr:hypothetical protein M9H77_09520 [Catharanthus roseus]